VSCLATLGGTKHAQNTRKMLGNPGLLSSPSENVSVKVYVKYWFPNYMLYITNHVSSLNLYVIFTSVCIVYVYVCVCVYIYICKLRRIKHLIPEMERTSNYIVV
jgi:hypothetical protein